MNNWFVGFAMGLLTLLAYEKLQEDPPPDVDIPITANDIVEAYKAGKRDALRTNVPSMELEQACLTLWSQKQPEELKVKKRKDIDLTEHALLAKDIYHIKDCIYALRAFLLERKSTLPEISQLRSMEARLDSLRSKLDKNTMR
jgi:hypothetical protein